MGVLNLWMRIALREKRIDQLAHVGFGKRLVQSEEGWFVIERQVKIPSVIVQRDGWCLKR